MDCDQFFKEIQKELAQMPKGAPGGPEAMFLPMFATAMETAAEMTKGMDMRDLANMSDAQMQAMMERKLTERKKEEFAKKFAERAGIELPEKNAESTGQSRRIAAQINKSSVTSGTGRIVRPERNVV